MYGEHVEDFETVTASGFNQATGLLSGEWGNLLAVYTWMNKASANNELWIDAFNDTNIEYRLIPGMAPIFFWPLDAATIEDILFHKAEIYYLYNPAHLVAKLRRAGFEVMPIPGQRGLKVEKRICDTIFRVENLSYYTHLGTREFWDEDVVVEALCGAARSVEQGDISPNAKMRMDFRQ
jgi:hypothetical protein